MATKLSAEETSETCPLCDADFGTVSQEQLPCCLSSVCTDCLGTYLRVRLSGGQHTMKCPLGDCTSEFQQEFVSKFLDETQLHKLELLRINALQSNTRRSCPMCTHILSVSEARFREMETAQTQAKDSAGVCQVLCPGCAKSWCYFCYGPAHPGLSCAENRDGDVHFNRWTKDWDKTNNQQNAFKCPQCKVPTQRDGGCPSMACTKCSCYWCYNCGQSLSSKSFYGLLGSHNGCKWDVNACGRQTICGAGKKVSKALRWFKLVNEVVVFSVCGVAIVALLLPLLPVLLFLAPPALFLLYSAKRTFD